MEKTGTQHDITETACCCIDVGSVLDNSDCTAEWTECYYSRAEAERVMTALTAKAQQIASEPCQVNHLISDVADGVKLEATFTFACQAEMIIFQLSLR